MTSRPSDSAFKYVFWGILLLAVLSLAGTSLFSIWSHLCSGFPPFPHIFAFPHLFRWMPFLLMFAIYVAVVGTLVHKDAAKRGMDPWLWTTIAVFVPSLIGVVIYLVVRANGQRQACIKCGKPLQRDFKICPYCGQSQEMLCRECKAPVAADWRVCPRCGHPLSPA